ncbi:MAG TPA: M4 family metallopeptidase [Candidatus Thermoplasmatota archaeon]|jgi:Zn-dependent metalloprotease|nr:M4 family metallopeptidase [Candidatus Thermoplasmatota archaeon]
MAHAPLQCILPPHILKHIALRGNARQRAWALETLSVSERMRGQRETFAHFTPRGAGAAAGQLQRNVYTASNGSILPGTIARREGQGPTGDAATDEAFDGAGATYELYYKQYERSSFDDRGAPINSTVHYGAEYNNAFWNGQQMVYGDGDGELFQRFTIALDVIGHELTHAVTQYEANLVYHGQSGALNESFSDVFGVLVKQFRLGQTADQADWLIGAGLFTDAVQGTALRSMKAPGTAYNDDVLGKDPQPAHMKDYVQTPDDNGGVHINSGIPNRAFYLAAAEIGGQAWERAGKIWYVALRDRLRRNASFQDCANITASVAAELYGQGSKEHTAVVKAWTTVGLAPSQGKGKK